MIRINDLFFKTFKQIIWYKYSCLHQQHDGHYKRTFKLKFNVGGVLATEKIFLHFGVPSFPI